MIVHTQPETSWVVRWRFEAIDMFRISLALFHLLTAAAVADATPARIGAPPSAGRGCSETRLFVREIKDEKAWACYSRTLGYDTFGKYVLDLETDDIYYFDVNVYRLHTDFVFPEES